MLLCPHQYSTHDDAFTSLPVIQKIKLIVEAFEVLMVDSMILLKIVLI